MSNFQIDITRVSDATTKRISSWDKTGFNRDWIVIKPGESGVLAEIKEFGKITHIWMAAGPAEVPEPYLLRKGVLKMYWDDEESPSVLTPIGDFFCLGHAIRNSFQSVFITTSSAGVKNTFGNTVSLNSYFPMPFNKSARIEILNENDFNICIWYYVDYEVYDKSHDDKVAYFHANFRRENPTPGWGHELSIDNWDIEVPNLSEENNYKILEAEGRGHLIGYNLSVTNLQTSELNHHQRTWWGEGDDMIFIDGESWPPSIHGTGSEDAFNHAWGMQDNAYLYNGSSIYEHNTKGYQTSYVFYATNPVHFKKSIRLSMEHGHANHLSNDFSSVAYWYQIEPHVKFDIIPVEQRLPLVQTFAMPEHSKVGNRTIELTEQMIEVKQQWKEKYESKKNKD
ncbi:DUF2961 domain-containing protein [Paenibacillus psychroresistens]|uniref:DUF2961 domain-containing protein n=1 Tax=Paenibacillus psychroresistens TaxID=1778678 RepID=A0A6B8RN69_9BACL|nr:glycoside hydrolase family 172 protein [Paenibacillus psychroresistens]QGQ97760.1 DUF2961 domain-containing protein [Paenibacillus psychroresistens]